MRRVLFAIAAALALPAVPVAADDFVCTEVLGVSVTGDWFGAWPTSTGTCSPAAWRGR